MVFASTGFGGVNSRDKIFNEYINTSVADPGSPVNAQLSPKQETNNEVQETPDQTDIKKSLQGIPFKDQACVKDSDCTAGVVDCDSWEPYNKMFSKELFKNTGSCPASIDPGFQPVARCVAKACKTTEKTTAVSWDDWLNER